MARKKPHGRPAARVSVHVTLPADVASRLRAFAGFHGRDVSDVVADGVRSVMRGFSARQEPAGPAPGQAAGSTLTLRDSNGGRAGVGISPTPAVGTVADASSAA